MPFFRQPSRRDVLGAAARLGLGATVGSLVPVSLSSQALSGKDARLIPRSLRPPDYETPVDLLDPFLTPLEHFYVRSHLPIPGSVDPRTWTVEVGGEVATPLRLTLDELRRMPTAVVTMTLECAGNGRAFFDPPVAGIQWRKGAVGTARWSGVRLRDLLTRAGIKSTGLFVTLNGADLPLGTMPDFVRQIPVAKAMDPDTLIAWEMNGQPIPMAHGFPLRAIVPGWEGAYAVKWLTGLTVLDRPFDGFWVSTAYRYPTRVVTPGAAVDPRDMAPLTGLVVKSLITTPRDGAIVRPGRIDVGGWAWAGEHEIAKVEVSLDRGATWQVATLTGEKLAYTWRRFQYAFETTRTEAVLILSRATDAQGQTQPMIAQWNPSGYLWNQPDSIWVSVRDNA